MTTAALAFVLMGSTAPAPKLNVGDTAPPLTISKWVKGNPVSSFEPGKAYVVEFWATWCGPCRRAMPHVTELQAKHPDVPVLAVDVWEQNLAKVEPFVKGNDANMGYTVCMDTMDAEMPADTKNKSKWSHDHGKMSEDWLNNSGWDKIGIPCAFIVDKAGKVAWIGDSNELDEPLEKVLAGTWDLAQAVVGNKAALAENDLRNDLQKDIDKAIADKNFSQAIKIEDDFINAKPEARIDLYGDECEMQLTKLKKAEDAYATAEKALTLATKDYTSPLPQIVNVLAYETPEGTPVNTELGMRIGKKADEMASGRRAGVKQALAKFSFLDKKYDDAVRYQKDAIALVTGIGDTTEYEKELKTYMSAAGGKGQTFR